MDTLDDLFRRVDRDKTGELHFGQFLTLLYYWAEVGEYTQLFPADQAEVLDESFSELETFYLEYDADKNRSLSRAELTDFVIQHLGGDVPPTFEAVCNDVFSPGSDALGFMGFLVLLYKLVRPKRAYLTGTNSLTNASKGSAAARTARQEANAKKIARQSSDVQVPMAETDLWKLLTHAYGTLEQDFQRFDKDGDMVIDLSELTAGISAAQPSDTLVDLVSRLEHIFRQVDLDQSDTLEFSEFLYLVYLLVEEGAYRQVVEKAVDASSVKKAFLFLRKAYSHFDSDGNMRLDRDEVRAFLVRYLGETPDNFDSVFDERMNPTKKHVDFVRFLALLYQLIMPSAAKFLAPTVAPQSLMSMEMRTPAVGSLQIPRSEKHPGRVDNFTLEEVHKEKKIGEGGFGVVHRAKFRECAVAAKYLKGDYTKEVLDEFLGEVRLMQNLNHENVVFMVGHVASPPDLCILTEFCTNGSIFDLIHRKRMRLHPSFIAKIGVDVAKGMHYLHTLDPPVIHRDLKSLNVLLTADYTAKVCDFGLSKVVAKHRLHTSGVGTPQWSAPEVMSGPNYDTKADVYSFGVLLWELTHKEVPYTGYDPIQMAVNVIAGMRPKISSRCDPLLAGMIRKCWAADPASRPPFSQVISELDEIRKELEGA